jgi:hypothetical protein
MYPSGNALYKAKDLSCNSLVDLAFGNVLESLEEAMDCPEIFPAVALVFGR